MGESIFFKIPTSSKVDSALHWKLCVVSVHIQFVVLAALPSSVTLTVRPEQKWILIVTCDVQLSIEDSRNLDVHGNVLSSL